MTSINSRHFKVNAGFIISLAVFSGAAADAIGQTISGTNARVCVAAHEVVIPAPGECGFNDLGANRGIFWVSSTDWNDGRGCIETRVFVRCYGP